jgi:hypothetical protein
MLVPVVQVRLVRMIVRDRFVRVRMRVPCLGRKARVRMRVVRLIVAMAVGMCDGFVNVPMLVSRGEKQRQTQGHDRPGDALDGRDRLAQHGP